MPTDSEPKDALPLRMNLLRCLMCGNTVECKPEDLLRFTRTKWLKCCGDVMTLFERVLTPDKPTS